ncbi:hypothetical protein GOB85_16905 [Acetobacter sp. LMG 1636]|nr:hypothetical protein [Acetobacter fallax]
MISRLYKSINVWNFICIFIIIFIIPLIISFKLLDIGMVDLSTPIYYDHLDGIWTLINNKVLYDTGWILNAPALGAPDVAHLYDNPAAQMSALHSVIMLCIRPFVSNAVEMQNLYYLLNFPLITLSSYVTCRFLRINVWISCCVGLIFSFTIYRFYMGIYSYLPNYFMVPFTILPPIWILIGKLNTETPNFLFRMAVSLIIVVIIAITDGYYAFFTLMLLLFSCTLRLMWSPKQFLRHGLLSPLLIFALIVSSLMLQMPLKHYRETHHAEFVQNGKPIAETTRYPFEAEVYSSSLKILIAPVPPHRIPMLGRIGQFMIDTSNAARRQNIGYSTALGTLGSVLLIGMFIRIFFSILHMSKTSDSHRINALTPVVQASTTLALFVFMTTISGGIGTLIALIYPTIRAYERFGLYLEFLLYVGGAAWISGYIADKKGIRRSLVLGGTFVVTLLAIWDQTPPALGNRDPENRKLFLAERAYTHKLQQMLSPGAMIYQYPFSEYLSNSPYYGWGDNRHIRLYVHSTSLRWSNGASKNSPVDLWHSKIAALPIEQLLREIESVGFSGFVVDRSVMPPMEYDHVSGVLIQHTGQNPLLGANGTLAFWKLPHLEYRLFYDADYNAVDRIVINNSDTVLEEIHRGNLSRMVDPKILAGLLMQAHPSVPFMLSRRDHPELFMDSSVTDAGLGIKPIASTLGLRGDVICSDQMVHSMNSSVPIALDVRNRSPFEWRINGGPLPITVGLQEVDLQNGKRILLDPGIRAKGSLFVSPGGLARVTIIPNIIDIQNKIPTDVRNVVAVFSLLQEGVSWFGEEKQNGVCRMIFSRNL